VVTAEDRRHWSYRPLQAVAPPAVHDGAWCRTPVDRFIAAALEARGIRPNVPADSRTLIRRLSFDLLGLPPAPGEVEAFVADLHATMLHLLGIDHKRLTYLHNGRRYRLTDVAGNHLTKVLA
jgi:hypothetical protein